jgi:mono/diheme cytochrome c family protein
MNDQQIQTVIDYVKSIETPRDANGKLPDEKQKEIQDEAERLVKAGTYSTIGEALFNLDLGGGNFSCARCHTKGWSYGDPQITGGGAFGPNLTGGSVVRQFPQRDEMIAFIKGGSEFGKKYGQQGQGSGRMPAFGLMLTDDQIAAVIDYVRGL